ncbi:Discoidin, CUB and LCCL domain-containing protein 1 [Triplophysa tibetana]|uniref:Discoidin, CUB and LCCL domain-containing protein 1 n=1 Tax=Triplophysa tibetana TaxID=1572043 RepID=A0A5A9N2Y4_9TELE|nr:Discoidin, CUB and LCCL domain-containing protein 1 [Triplophysa tibetana]
MALVCGQRGDGCGHTVLSPTSGTLASRNFPGTYPNHTQCEWNLMVPVGRTLLLTFGDFDLEWSQDCVAGSLTITDSSGSTRVGPLCGQLAASKRNMSVSTNEVTVRFISGAHRSGRGFVMSYSTNQQPECDAELTVLTYNSSSVWMEVNRQGQEVSWSGKGGSQWAASSDDQQPWLELELGNKSSVTGIVTKGTLHHYIESYTLMFSKDRKNWKVYKAISSKDKKVFEGFSDGHVTAFNSLIPPIIARYLLLKPQQWRIRASAQVQVLGCPSALPRPRSHGDDLNSSKGVITEAVPIDTLPTEGPVITRSSGPSQAVILVAGMVLGAALCISCLLAGLLLWKRKRNAQIKKSCVDQGYQGLQGKRPCINPELVSYPLVRNIHDALPNPPLNDYAEPDVVTSGQMVGLTFRPQIEEGYTIPYTLNHYDTPGDVPEYTSPLPPEPEYATPFGEFPIDSLTSPPLDSHHNTKLSACRSTQGTSSDQQYDCPAHRVISNGPASRNWLPGAKGILLVFDLGDRTSFEHAEYLHGEMCSMKHVDTVLFMLVGHKCDQNVQKVNRDEAERLASKLRAPYFEDSANTGHNVAEIFELMTRRIYQGMMSGYEPSEKWDEATSTKKL